MRLFLWAFGVVIVASCSATPPASTIEVGGVVSGRLITSKGCDWLETDNLPLREAASAAGAKFSGMNNKRKFIGTDKSEIGFELAARFIAAEGPTKGKCSDENALLLYRVVQP